MRAHTFSLPKRGNQADEYEDAAAADPVSGRFAVADGASESSFAEPWAKLLVEAHLEAPVRWRRRWRDWLPPLQERWLAAVRGKSLPWYAEAKLEQGAFAAFLGLVLEPAEGRWRAVAVGDSCLFRVSADELCEAFPLEKSSEFGNQPMLLGSRTPCHVIAEERRARYVRGRSQARDRFYLATDALAQWFLKQQEEENRPWEALDDNRTNESFAAWIEKLRDEGQIRNDDVTLIAIDL